MCKSGTCMQVWAHNSGHLILNFLFVAAEMNSKPSTLMLHRPKVPPKSPVVFDVQLLYVPGKRCGPVSIL